MAKNSIYFDDEGMKEKSGKQKFYAFFLAIFDHLLGWVLFFRSLTVLAIVLFLFWLGLGELNLKINQNFYDGLEKSEQKWFDGVDHANILIDKETCQTLQLKIDILNHQHSPASYNNFDSNLYWVPKAKVRQEFHAFKPFVHSLEKILLSNNISKLWVFTRGYADKSNLEYIDYPLNKDYLYSKIDYYPIRNGVFEIANKTKTVKMRENQYQNSDLIYLRANFVKEVYFKKLLESLTFKKSHFAVLEGKSIDKRNKSFRKVNVYMAFCKEKKDLTLLDKLHWLKMKVLLWF